MNCNCLQETCQKIKERLSDKDVLLVECLDAAMIFPTEKGKEATLKTYSTFGVTVNKKKKVEELKMLHNYCPFCGKKIDKGE